MRHFNSIATTVVFFFLISGLYSCTNLDEKVYDQLPVDEFGQNDAQVSALVAPVYRTLKNAWSHNTDYFGLGDLSSGMAVNPTRIGGDGWESGFFKDLAQHSWTSTLPYLNGIFSNTFESIGRCNKIINLLENSEADISNKEQIISEIRGVRAYWYYMLIDYFGNVPIVKDFNDTVSAPKTMPRSEVYKFVLSELNDIKNKVRSDVTSASYGKVTKGVVYTLLAKMYLNAEIWNPEGGPKWEECIAACDTVMSLDYIIEPNWKANFAVHNEESREIIFPIIFSTADGGNVSQAMTLHYLDPEAMGMHIGAWNMVCAMPSFVKSYDPEDKRKKWSFLIGPTLDPQTGDTLVTVQGHKLVHTVDIDMKYGVDDDGWGQVDQEDGARINKWEFEKGLSGDAENDFAIFRLADVYLMKAEALVRSGKNNKEATDLVNTIRSRAFDDPSKLYDHVTLNEIYWEELHELAWENKSRQIMIRFGTYRDAIPGWRKASTNDKWLLFPIPLEALDKNPNLKQNKGY